MLHTALVTTAVPFLEQKQVLLFKKFKDGGKTVFNFAVIFSLVGKIYKKRFTATSWRTK